MLRDTSGRGSLHAILHFHIRGAPSHVKGQASSRRPAYRMEVIVRKML